MLSTTENASEKEGAILKRSQTDEIKELIAQIAALVKARKASDDTDEDNTVAMFVALRCTLEEVASNSVNGPASDGHYTDFPHNIIGSG